MLQCRNKFGGISARIALTQTRLVFALKFFLRLSVSVFGSSFYTKKNDLVSIHWNSMRAMLALGFLRRGRAPR